MTDEPAPGAGSNDLREELAAVINAAGREVDLNAVRALVDHVQPKLDRLAFELRHTRAELGKADAENNAAGRRAEQAEAAIERVRAIHYPKTIARIVPCEQHAPVQAWFPVNTPLHQSCPGCREVPEQACANITCCGWPCETAAALEPSAKEET